MSEIRVRVAEPDQLFEAIDPSPFGSRDLAPRVEAFIVGWAKELGRGRISLAIGLAFLVLAASKLVERCLDPAACST